MDIPSLPRWRAAGELVPGRRPCFRPPWPLAFLLLAALAPAPRSAADDSLEDVKREYRESIAALNPIWTRCELKRTHAVEVPEIGWEDFEGRPTEWAVQGTKFLCQWDASNTRYWFSYDGTTTWMLDYGFASRKEDPDLVKCARRQRLETITDSDLRSQVTVGQWLGLYFAAAADVQSGESLSTMLEKPSAGLVGREDVAGHSCVRVNLVMRWLSGREKRVHAWFDPSVGFLPRKILVDSRPVIPVDDKFVVESFRAVTNESGARVYVPERMTRTMSDEDTPTEDLTEALLLKEVRLGQDVPGDLFQPKLPSGVPVFTVDDDRGMLNWQNFLNSTRPKAQQQAIVQEVATPSPATAVAAARKPALAAEPESGWSWSITLFVAGVALVVLATWKFRR